MSFFSSPPDIVQTQSSEEGFAPNVLTVAGHSCSNVRDASTDPEDAHLVVEETFLEAHGVLGVAHPGSRSPSAQEQICK